MKSMTGSWRLLAAGGCLLTSIAHAEPAEFNYDAFVQAVDDVTTQLEAVQRQVDQTRFDAQDWLDTLDYDAETVLQAVATEIAFQPYDGVLRGVNGTLQSRAGNSTDQALLLAFLLNSAGYDARIVRAELTEADASRLLGTLGSTRQNESLLYLVEAAAKAGLPLAPDVQAQDPATSAVARQVAGVSEHILRMLKTGGFDLAPADVTDELLTKTRNYFWVQHRDGPSDDWQDAHPAFSRAAAPDIEPAEYFSDTIPDDYLHTLTVSAWLTQKLGDKLEDARLMADVTRPVANLHGKAIHFRNFPGGLSPERLTDLAGAVEDTRILIPTLNGGMAPGAQAFDLNGHRVDPMAASGPAADLFSTLADKMEGAASAVAEEENLVSLEAMWLEFTFSAPDGSSSTSRRYLIAPGTEFEHERDRVWPLITDHTYVINAGHIPLDYLAERYLAGAIGGMPVLKALAHKLFFPEAGTPMPDAPPSDIGPLVQYRLMESNPDARTPALRLQPNLLGYRFGYRSADRAFFGVDVVANGTRRLQRVNGRVLLDVQAAIRQGVWDTGVEKVPGLNFRAETRTNALETLIRAGEQDIDLHLITSGAELKGLDLEASTANLARAELERGYVLIVPEKTPAGSPLSGWWRVHPGTGETLGMTADGYGAELAEYLTDMIGIGLTLIDAVQGLKACEEQMAMDARLCCLMETHMNTSAGNAISSVAGETGGSSNALAFTLQDKMTQAILNVPSVMPSADLGCDTLPQTEW